MFDLADSCLVLHGRSNFKVCLLALFRQQLKTAHFDPDGIYVPFFCCFVLIATCILYSYYGTKAVFIAMGVTALVCIAVTVFCFQTKVHGDVNCLAVAQ